MKNLQRTVKGADSRFIQPVPVSDVDLAFPARALELMPSTSDIPPEFLDSGNQWVAWQDRWFFHGLKSLPTPRQGIDLNMAMRHLAVIQNSYAPKHEHKMAAVAFLASCWFEAEGTIASPQEKA